MDFTHSYQQQQSLKLRQAMAAQDDLSPYAEAMSALYESGWQRIFRHGDYRRWSDSLNALPELEVTDIDLQHQVRVGHAETPGLDSTSLKQTLMQMSPWRKGPFELFGIHIDTEWRSDWKWQRVKQHISPLQGRTILDIGCGSGYHLWRMYGEGAKLTVGIDPTPLFSFHFATMKRYQSQAPVFLIPTGIDEMPEKMEAFDTVFSMGILYHRREPLEHLNKIKGLLKEGGELVLETLVVDGDERTCLMPSERYGKMRNVWFIPSVAMLKVWLNRVGFSQVSCVDINVTTVEEQRVTEWMRFESLADYLDPDDRTKTIEGYPAPKRAVLVAKV